MIPFLFLIPQAFWEWSEGSDFWHPFERETNIQIEDMYDSGSQWAELTLCLPSPMPFLLDLHDMKLVNFRTAVRYNLRRIDNDDLQQGEVAMGEGHGGEGKEGAWRRRKGGGGGEGKEGVEEKERRGWRRRKGGGGGEGKEGVEEKERRGWGRRKGGDGGEGKEGMEEKERRGWWRVKSGCGGERKEVGGGEGKEGVEEEKERRGWRRRRKGGDEGEGVDRLIQWCHGQSSDIQR